MAEFRVLSRLDQTTGEMTSAHKAIWRGEANSFYEAKEKAAAVCKWKIQPEDMIAYNLTSDEIK